MDRYIMIYKVLKDKNKVKILGKDFTRRNEKNGIIIYNNKRFPLFEEIDIKDIKEDKLTIEMMISKKFLIFLLCLKIVKHYYNSKNIII